MRVCLVYDCLFPYTVGGAERWYRNLGERLAADGHEVTYLTLRQWDRGQRGEVPGVRVVAAGPRMRLYAEGGRRRILPPLVFGAGVLWHLLRHGARYDVVHAASFPYFSLLAAALARPLRRFRLVVDWHELWSSGYWREYLGPVGGRIGAAVQKLCLRIPQRAFCFSQLHARRLREAPVNGELTVLEGEYAGSLEAREPEAAQPVVVFAGRHIPEKRVPAVVPALALARERIPGLRGEVYGDGPQREEVLRLRAEHGLDGELDVPGFVAAERVEQALAHALCMLLPSRREGYGMVVVEAAALGTPSVVVAGEDNAATDLVSEGENGYVAASASPEDLAAAIERVHAEGHALRERTAAWFRANAERLSLSSSLEKVLDSYRAASARR
ncbi:MAG TPA: glycosyltransferase [Thermoleophilaceae bacterium]|nr:glycosyltransferase [Thermoleophilaceae bacterium]